MTDHFQEEEIELTDEQKSLLAVVQEKKALIIQDSRLRKSHNRTPMPRKAARVHTTLSLSLLHGRLY
jgi:hypothetical protein